MKTVIYVDNTLSLAVEPLCVILNLRCDKFSFAPGKEKLHLKSDVLSCPDSYNSLSKNILVEAKSYDLALLFTSVPYENNYFFEYEDNIALVSFSNWNLLTELPVANGLVYFIASIMCDEYGIGESHEDNIGCLNDFRWDKTGVDVGMRAAFICQECQNKYKGDPAILGDINKLLDLVSHASRAEKDILKITLPVSASEEVFDVFLCYNSEDKPFIKKMNAVFKMAEVTTWFDEEQVEPGELWQDELEKQIANIQAVCVFVGENGIGPWQKSEIRVFLNEFVSRNCKIIPVILTNATVIPSLPLFLRQMEYIDFREDYELNLQKLVKVLRKK